MAVYVKHRQTSLATVRLDVSSLRTGCIVCSASPKQNRRAECIHPPVLLPYYPSLPYPTCQKCRRGTSKSTRLKHLVLAGSTSTPPIVQ